MNRNWTYLVPRKHSFFVLFSIVVLAFGAVSAHAQSRPAAYKSGLSLSAGGEASAFQPDFAGGSTPQTSPNRLYGIGTYVDLKITRWAQLEAEARWLRFNEYLGISENTYLIGPIVPIHTYKRRFTPYAKGLVGFGTGTLFTGRATTYAFGGGLDYRLNKRFSLRGDFEYERWRVHPAALQPYGVSVGVTYKIF
jgi:hypothetical protein